jgi:putative iron-regulated protein
MLRCSAVACAVATLAMVGCGSDAGDGPAGPDPKVVVANYAKLVHANYEEALDKAVALQTALEAFVAAPDAAKLDAARAAWKDARPDYLQTEAFRFYGGPIDDEATGPEARINGWPLDEVYIDYVEGRPTDGIINHPTEFPTIDKTLIADQNELGGEKNLSAGYHAIEFLLWGQDQSTTGPGNRPFTDFVTGAGGTAMNQDRRVQYLKEAAALLVDDLRFVEESWEPGQTNYASTFVADEPRKSLSKMLTGMGSLSATELPKERMNNAYETRDQEEEHSCFSDNTHVDHMNNALGIQNVYLGRYGTLDGPGLDELVRAKNPDLDNRMQANFSAVLAAIEAIPKPFDQAISDDAARVKIKAAMDALKTLTDTTVEVASLLGLTINLE